MKILIYGAGVIGCIYGLQLNKAGHDITVLVRENKKELIEKEGINIHCSDYRTGEKNVENATFYPKVIDALLAENDFEYIIVVTGSHYLCEVLPVLKESAGKADILFFQNLWINDFDEINKYLSPKQYFVGFPFMAGGGRDEKEISGIISGSKYSKTILGEVSGEITPRVEKIAKVMADASMKPFISNQIITWLIPHYVFIAAISAGIIKAGGTMQAFINDSGIIKETILSIREGFRVCEKMGINPKREKVNKLYYFPLFISCPVVKKVFSDATMQAMFDGYLKNSTNEVKMMMDNVILKGNDFRVGVICLMNLRE